MGDSSSSTKTISLKLLINTQAKKVLFAEAGKDFVDFLFSVLSLPVAEIISLVRKHGMVGSLPNLYESVEKLNDSYVQSSHTKTTLLTPPMVYNTGGVPLLAINAAPASTNRKFYSCSHSCRSSYGTNNVSDDPRATCPTCRQKMTTPMSFVSPPAGELQVSGEGGGGFVKGVVTYMVMDDLVVSPMSTISSITMINKFNISNVGALEERVVDFGVDEAAKLLKTSLEAKNVLTRVFLK